MKNYWSIFLAIIVLMITVHQADALPITEVQFQSNYVFEAPGGYNSIAKYMGSEINKFIFRAKDYTNDGIVDMLEVSGEANNPYNNELDWWNFDFTTRFLNQNLTPGTYKDVGPFPFESNSEGGFSAGITGVALDTTLQRYYGEFTINDFVYDYSAPGSISYISPDNRIKSFAADFFITDTTYDINVLKGHVYYNYEPISASAVPEPTSMLLFSTGIIGAFYRRRLI